MCNNIESTFGPLWISNKSSLLDPCLLLLSLLLYPHFYGGDAFGICFLRGNSSSSNANKWCAGSENRTNTIRILRRLAELEEEERRAIANALVTEESSKNECPISQSQICYWRWNGPAFLSWSRAAKAMYLSFSPNVDFAPVVLLYICLLSAFVCINKTGPARTIYLCFGDFRFSLEKPP